VANPVILMCPVQTSHPGHLVAEDRLHGIGEFVAAAGGRQVQGDVLGDFLAGGAGCGDFLVGFQRRGRVAAVAGSQAHGRCGDE